MTTRDHLISAGFNTLHEQSMMSVEDYAKSAKAIFEDMELSYTSADIAAMVNAMAKEYSTGGFAVVFENAILAVAESLEK